MIFHKFKQCSLIPITIPSLLPFHKLWGFLLSSWACHAIVPKDLPCLAVNALICTKRNRVLLPHPYLRWQNGASSITWANITSGLIVVHMTVRFKVVFTMTNRYISSLLSGSKCHLQHGNGDYAPHPINQVAHRADSGVMKWTPPKTCLDARICELRVLGTMVSWNRWALIRVCICSCVNGASPDSG